MELEERVAELESRLSFQDDTLQVLSNELVAQQRLIERLRSQVDQLARAQQELLSRVSDGPTVEPPPPHY